MNDAPLTILYTGLRPPSNEGDGCVRHRPTIRIVFLEARPDAELAAFLGREDLRVVFPSRNAVLGFASWLESAECAVAAGEMYAVGRGTARAVEERFDRPAILPETPTAAGLIERLETEPPAPTLLITGESGRPELPAWLGAQAFPTRTLCVYRTERVENETLRDELRDCDDEWVVFTSPSTIEGFLASLGRSDLSGLRCRFAAIGPTTARAVVDSGGESDLVSEEPSAAALIDQILRERPNGATHGDS